MRSHEKPCQINLFLTQFIPGAEVSTIFWIHFRMTLAQLSYRFDKNWMKNVHVGESSSLFTTAATTSCVDPGSGLT